MKALIIGHSFIKRADKFVRQGREDTDINLRLQDVSLTWKGYSGLTTSFLDLKSHIVYSVNPDIVVVDIGSNDLSNSKVIPSKLARRVYSLALSLLQVSQVKCVFLLDICPRGVWARFPARRDFNAAADLYNLAIRALCERYNHPIFPAPLRGLRRDIAYYLSKDGVHLGHSIPRGLSHSGIFKYTLSIRRAIVRGIEFCRGGPAPF